MVAVFNDGSHTVRTMKNKLTFSQVQKLLAEKGCTISNTGYEEYKVRVKGSPKGQGYFATDLEDALATGLVMAENKTSGSASQFQAELADEAEHMSPDER
jgi:hypothetical protein